MNAIVAASVVALSQLLVAQSPCAAFDEKWSSCRADSECVVGFTACHSLAAYNKASLADVEKYNTCTAPMIKCTPGDSEADRAGAKATCSKAKCVVVKKK